jgi:hypothetical protein
MYNPTYPETLYFALNGKKGGKEKKKLLAAACRLIMYITLYY